jgi:hypothetical protein
VLHQVHKPQNALLHQKMQKSLLSGIVPIITQLVQDGIRHGIFNTNYPAEAVEMLMLYSNAAFDELAEQTSAEREQRMKGFIYNTERILGVSEGDLRDTLMRILL